MNYCYSHSFGVHNISCPDCSHHEPLADWERDLLECAKPAHAMGYGEVTFTRIDGRSVTVDNVRVDSVGTDYGLYGVVSMEVEGQDSPLHMPFIESWTVDYRV